MPLVKYDTPDYNRFEVEIVIKGYFHPVPYKNRYNVLWPSVAMPVRGTLIDIRDYIPKHEQAPELDQSYWVESVNNEIPVWICLTPIHGI